MSELTPHWASELEIGDRCKATLRHATDGTKNIHNAEVIVIANYRNTNNIEGAYNNVTHLIPYNELSK